MKVTDEDVDQLVADLLETADLLKKDGVTAGEVLESWTPGPRSASTEPNSRGWSYKECDDETCTTCPHEVPSDPTGEAILQVDKAGEIHGHYVTALDAARASITTIRGLIKIAHPQASKRRKIEVETDETIAAAGWCISCWRDAKACEPIAVGRYAEYCRWCGDFRHEHAALLGAQGQPPIELVKARRSGKRLSRQMVAKAMARYPDVSRAAKKKGRRK